MNDPYYDSMDTMIDIANEIRNGARKDDYGHVHENHQRIAAGWSVLLRKDISAADVARCMAWLKMVRSTTSPEKLDSYIDGANYIIMAGAMETAFLLDEVEQKTPPHRYCSELDCNELRKPGWWFCAQHIQEDGRQ